VPTYEMTTKKNWSAMSLLNADKMMKGFKYL
jgi:hypothetical protein